MKSNSFLRIIVVSVSAICAIACDSDSPAQEDFFNLNIGNEYVYKKYHPVAGELTFSGITDSVRIQDITTFNGVEFSRLEHKKYNLANEMVSTYNEYLRVNLQGHLVGWSEESGLPYDYGSIAEDSGIVFHPGEDIAYTDNVEQFTSGGDVFGNIFYYVSPETTLQVEGVSYVVSPYKGDYTPIGESNSTKTVEFNFAAETGLVKRVCHAAFGNYFWEDRLVSATIVD